MIRHPVDDVLLTYMKRLYRNFYSKLFYLFAACALCSTSALAQHTADCGTDESQQKSTLNHVKNRSNWPAIRSSAIQYIPVRFHIIGAVNGAFAIDSFLVFDELYAANEFYAGAEIEFYHCGNVNFIYDNSYVNFIKNESETLCDQEDTEGVINIYFAPNVERDNGESLCGYAYNYDIKRRVIMDNSCSTNSSTLAHELGHALSLLHTHSTSNGTELANGSNCSEAGDLLCDTPADPRLSSDNVSSSCVYTGSQLDPLGTPYDPDPNNIMSYSRKNCRNLFSQEQLNQMAAFHLVNEQLLFCNPDSISSVADRPDNSDFSIFPNPASDVITLKSVQGPAEVRIISINGKNSIYTTINSESTERSIPVHTLAPGSYFVVIHSKNSTRTKHMIKY